MVTQKTLIKIDGMTCGHCEKSVNKIISGMDGVITCSVSLSNASAEVVFDPSKTSRDTIIKAVNDSEIYKAF